MPEDEVIEHQETEQADVTPESVVEDMQQDAGEGQAEPPQEKMVPLAALQKERKKRQEAEWAVEYHM